MLVHLCPFLLISSSFSAITDVSLAIDQLGSWGAGYVNVACSAVYAARRLPVRSSISGCLRSARATSRPTELDEAEVFYPLHVRLCDACLLVQLPAYVSGEHIFSDYAYFSSYSDSWVAHAKRYAEAMIERLGPDPRQPRHRGGQQRRLPAAALPGGGHPGARRRAGRERGRGGPRPGHPDRSPVPRRRRPARADRAASTAGPTWWPRTTSSPMCRTSAASRPACARWSRTTGW